MKIMNPKNISQLIDNSYLGYSLGSGVFLRNSTNVWIVSGAPRGASLNGQVQFGIINFFGGKKICLI